MAERYKVNGMSCGGCAAAVETAIHDLAPDASVEVDLDNASVTVNGISEARMKEAVDNAGFEFGGRID